MKKKEINYANFPYSDDSMSIKALHSILYSMDENIVPRTSERVSRNTIIALLVSKGYIKPNEESGYQATDDLGKVNGFYHNYYMGSFYIMCTKKAQKIVLELISEYIKKTNSAFEERAAEKKEVKPKKEKNISLPEEIKESTMLFRPITECCFYKDVAQVIIDGRPDIPKTKVKEIILEYLSSEGYLSEGEKLEIYKMPPTAKGEELGIRNCKFTCDNPDIDMEINYFVYLPAAANFVLEHFNDAIRLYNENHPMEGGES